MAEPTFALRQWRLDALWAPCGERDVSAADFLERYGVGRADVATRLS